MKNVLLIWFCLEENDAGQSRPRKEEERKRQVERTRKEGKDGQRLGLETKGRRRVHEETRRKNVDNL
jgi:hypothetical protein